ncbi:cyclin-dependent protein kinase [Gonapodya sp. JEL0774]|nr:cyclin-dependent protein kinase [Gonapodya sp. JEL0774]
MAMPTARALLPLLCPPSARDLALAKKYASAGGESLAEPKRRELAVVARPIPELEVAKKKGGKDRINKAVDAIVEKVRQRLEEVSAENVVPERVLVPENDLRDLGVDVFAVQASCPHMGGPLELGDIEELKTTDGRPAIRCPLHSYDFDLVTGACFFMERRLDHVDATAFRTSIRLSLPTTAPAPSTDSGNPQHEHSPTSAETSVAPPAPHTPESELKAEPYIFIEYVLPPGSGAAEVAMLEVLEWEAVSTYGGAKSTASPLPDDYPPLNASTITSRLSTLSSAVASISHSADDELIRGAELRVRVRQFRQEVDQWAALETARAAKEGRVCDLEGEVRARMANDRIASSTSALINRGTSPFLSLGTHPSSSAFPATSHSPIPYSPLRNPALANSFASLASPSWSPPVTPFALSVPSAASGFSGGGFGALLGDPKTRGSGGSVLLGSTATASLRASQGGLPKDAVLVSTVADQTGDVAKVCLPNLDTPATVVATTAAQSPVVVSAMSVVSSPSAAAAPVILDPPHAPVTPPIPDGSIRRVDEMGSSSWPADKETPVVEQRCEAFSITRAAASEPTTVTIRRRNSASSMKTYRTYRTVPDFELSAEAIEDRLRDLEEGWDEVAARRQMDEAECKSKEAETERDDPEKERSDEEPGGLSHNSIAANLKRTVSVPPGQLAPLTPTTDSVSVSPALLTPAPSGLQEAIPTLAPRPPPPRPHRRHSSRRSGRDSPSGSGSLTVPSGKPVRSRSIPRLLAALGLGSSISVREESASEGQRKQVGRSHSRSRTPRPPSLAPPSPVGLSPVAASSTWRISQLLSQSTLAVPGLQDFPTSAMGNRRSGVFDGAAVAIAAERDENNRLSVVSPYGEFSAMLSASQNTSAASSRDRHHASKAVKDDESAISSTSSSAQTKDSQYTANTTPSSPTGSTGLHELRTGDGGGKSAIRRQYADFTALLAGYGVHSSKTRIVSPSLTEVPTSPTMNTHLPERKDSLTKTHARFGSQSEVSSLDGGANVYSMFPFSEVSTATSNRPERDQLLSPRSSMLVPQYPQSPNNSATSEGDQRLSPRSELFPPQFPEAPSVTSRPDTPVSRSTFVNLPPRAHSLTRMGTGLLDSFRVRSESDVEWSESEADSDREAEPRRRGRSRGTGGTKTWGIPWGWTPASSGDTHGMDTAVKAPEQLRTSIGGRDVLLVQRMEGGIAHETSYAGRDVDQAEVERSGRRRRPKFWKRFQKSRSPSPTRKKADLVVAEGSAGLNAQGDPLFGAASHPAVLDGKLSKSNGVTLLEQRGRSLFRTNSGSSPATLEPPPISETAMNGRSRSRDQRWGVGRVVKAVASVVIGNAGGGTRAADVKVGHDNDNDEYDEPTSPRLHSSKTKTARMSMSPLSQLANSKFEVHGTMDVEYKRQKDATRTRIDSRYKISGFISSGTYGKVYRAVQIATGKDVAIKKFKPEKDFDPQASAFSQSACREIALCRELRHENVVSLEEVMIDPADRSIYMIFDYAEHDLLQILHHHGHTERKPVSEVIVKSLLYQLINGVAYLHANWVLHRDLKPANILLTPAGTVKIGDLGLARLFLQPLLPLFSGDKVVVTIWYRSPELLLGARHYTKAVDMWAIGCIFAELLILRPLFKGEEAKMDSKKNIPFQRHQLLKIFEVLGTPVAHPHPQGNGLPGLSGVAGERAQPVWKGMEWMPEFHNLAGFPNYPATLRKVIQHSSPHFRSERGFDLLARMLEYDPNKRITAEQALQHPYFQEEPLAVMNPFDVHPTEYPKRKITPLDSSDDHMVAGKQQPGQPAGSANQPQMSGSFASYQVPLVVHASNYTTATQYPSSYKQSGSRVATMPQQFSHIQPGQQSRPVAQYIPGRQSQQGVAISQAKYSSGPPGVTLQVGMGLPVQVQHNIHSRTTAPLASMNVAASSRSVMSIPINGSRSKSYGVGPPPVPMTGHVVPQQALPVGNAGTVGGFQSSQTILGQVNPTVWAQSSNSNVTMTLPRNNIQGIPHQVVQTGQKRKKPG